MSGMPGLADQTSPRRVALAREITLAARADRDLRARIEADLSAVGFEDMTLDSLTAMAKAYGVDKSKIDGITATHSAELTVIRARFLCRVCSDERLVAVDDGAGWLPCPNCNVVPADVAFDPARC